MSIILNFRILIACLLLPVVMLFSCKKENESKSDNIPIVKRSIIEIPPAPEGSPVAKHGKLQIKGVNLCDESGNAVQLKGMSLYWSQWSNGFWNKDVVDTLADDWKCTVIRAAMGIAKGGYLENTGEIDKLKTVLDAAIKKGIYVIIDWHDHDAISHTEESKKFFAEMAATYGQYPNVIFEIFNEPINDQWLDVRKYSETVIETIRANGSDNIIIVGTTSWSQDVDIAAEFPVKNGKNVAYALHFYAATHKKTYRDRAEAAIAKGLPLFVSEWGTCENNGDGFVDIEESLIWIDFMDKHKLSWCNWSLFNKMESASALKADATPSGRWKNSLLTESGRFIKKKISE